MKILFIAEKYMPDNCMAAVRPSKFSKYLTKDFDFNVDLLTTSQLAEDDYLKKIIRMPQKESQLSKLLNRLLNGRKQNMVTTINNNKKSLHAQIAHKQSGCIKKTIVRLRDYIFYSLNFIATLSNSRMQYKYFKRHILNKNNFKEYDVVISTYAPLYSHLIAMKLKKKYNLKWISDFRDPIYGGVVPPIMHPICKFYSKRITKISDSTTIVAEEGLKSYDIYKNAKVFILRNGFDLDDYLNLPKENNENCLIMTYAGTFYKDMRSLYNIFKAIKNLIDNGKVNKKKVKIVYAGRQSEYILEWAHKCDLTDIVSLMGIINKEDSLKLSATSDVNLLATWNRKNSQGIISGKFYELLAIGRPILAEISGDLPKSEVSKLIAKTNSGYCYEESISKGNTQELENKILEWYNKKINNGCLQSEMDNEETQFYNYKNLTKQLKDIIAQT